MNVREPRPAWAILRAGLREGPAIFGATVALMIVQGLLPPALILTTGAIVGTVPAVVRDGTGSPAAGRMVAALVAMAVIIVGQQGLAQLVGELVSELGRRVDQYFVTRAMRVVLEPTGIAHLEEPAVLDQLARARGLGSEWETPGGALRSYFGITTVRLSILGSAVLLASFRWWLAAGMVAAAPVIRHFILADVFRTSQVFMEMTPSLRHSEYLRDLILTPAAAKEYRLFGFFPWVLREFRRHWLTAMEDVWARRRIGGRVRGRIMLALFAMFLLAYVLVALSAAHSELSLGKLTVVVQAVGAVGMLGRFSEFDWELQYGKAALPGLFALERRLSSPTVSSGRRDADGLPGTAIRFEGVGFAYAGSARNVYEHLDLEVTAGRSTAIVGENGAGKTTLVKLLSRLYEPTSGAVTVDGIDVREIHADAWHDRLAVIFQDYVHYELTARDNVVLGRPADESAMREAARKAGILDVVESLPRGWDTVLSRQYADGADLSGGQWQRLALARALYAVECGATVLVLDEPTANLDVRAEADIYDRFLDLTAGLTTILISHRFSTVRRAERICVIESGRVTELGSHDELLARGGHYAHMFRLQASRFVDA